MLGIVILAGHEGLEAARQAVDGTVVRRVIFVGEEDIEGSIQLLCREDPELLGD